MSKYCFETARMNNRYPPFSVAMSVYKNDNPAFFEKALESIITNQTQKPSEIIVVVDGPVSKELNDVLEKYTSQYSVFNVIRLSENGGLGNALRVAVENASNELIARMDSDDIAIPARFEKQLQFFALHPETDIVGGNISEFIDKPENTVGKRIVPTSDKEIKSYIKKRCPFNHMTVMFKKSVINRAGGYVDWYYNEDYYLWIRLYLNNAEFANVNDILVNVRVGEDMYRRRGGIKYFNSEAKLQKYMLDNKAIGLGRYILNVSERLVLQVLMPNSLRGWFFKRFARSNINE